MANTPESKAFGANKTYSAASTVSKLPQQPQVAIPKEVANRMARRIAITTGLPTISGMAVFIGSYVVVTKGIADIAPSITLIGSAACFLTGLLGLSYGILSASWDDLPGTLLGFENIKPNIKRMKDAFTTPQSQKN